LLYDRWQGLCDHSTSTTATCCAASADLDTATHATTDATTDAARTTTCGAASSDPDASSDFHAAASPSQTCRSIQLCSWAVPRLAAGQTGVVLQDPPHL